MSVAVATPAPEPSRLANLKRRLSSEGLRALSPEELARQLKEKSERANLLRALMSTIIVDAARRDVNRAKEAIARARRNEAAERDRAQAKLDADREIAARHDATKAERQGQAVQRREDLRLAVSMNRTARATEREVDHDLQVWREAKALRAHAQALNRVRAKSACVVKHSLVVKEKAEEQRRAYAAQLGAALGRRAAAAESRRAEQLECVVMRSGYLRDFSFAWVRRLSGWRSLERIQRKKVHFSSMSAAIERRAERLRVIAAKAAAANARAADVASTQREKLVAEPAALRHALAVRMQKAEVSRGAQLQATPYKAKPPELLVVPIAHSAPRALLPPAGLLARLMFRPKLLVATAAARHSRAAGNRTTRAAVIKATAAHYGTTRLANAAGRRAIDIEVKRAILEVRCQSALARAAEASLCRAARAAAYNRRVVAAAARRTTGRIECIDAAILREDERAQAEARRELKTSEVVCRAKLSATPRHTPVKITCGEAGIALLKSREEPTSVLDSVNPVIQDMKEQTIEANREEAVS